MHEALRISVEADFGFIGQRLRAQHGGMFGDATFGRFRSQAWLRQKIQRARRRQIQMGSDG